MEYSYYITYSPGSSGCDTLASPPTLHHYSPTRAHGTAPGSPTMLEIASTNSPVGSATFSVFALVAISLVVLAILRFYLPLRTTPAFYLVPIFFALWLPAIVIILVPIDLASSATTDDDATRGIWLPERVILVSWRITYWLTFVLTWYGCYLVTSATHYERSVG